MKSKRKMDKEGLLCHNRQNIAEIIGCFESRFDTIYMREEGYHELDGRNE